MLNSKYKCRSSAFEILLGVVSGVVGGIGSGSFMRLLCSLEVVAVEYVLGLLISEHQHGFVPGRSCTTQLLEALDQWTSILDDKGSIDIVYMD